ncbi:hypothetical protein IQ263_13510 [Tychonema sp. LEGE 06208]|nr:hypothetical protein [Tychonema sp. LEGE 06208]
MLATSLPRPIARFWPREPDISVDRISDITIPLAFIHKLSEIICVNQC